MSINLLIVVKVIKRNSKAITQKGSGDFIDNIAEDSMMMTNDYIKDIEGDISEKETATVTSGVSKQPIISGSNNK